MELPTVTRTIELALGLDEARRAVLDAAWLGDEVDLALVAGAAGTVREGDVVRRAVVTEADAGRVRLLWWEEADPAVVSTVEIEVAGDDERSTVTVTEAVLGGSVARLDAAAVTDLGTVDLAWDRRLRALVGEVALAPAVA